MMVWMDESTLHLHARSVSVLCTLTSDCTLKANQDYFLQVCDWLVLWHTCNAVPSLANMQAELSVYREEMLSRCAGGVGQVQSRNGVSAHEGWMHMFVQIDIFSLECSLCACEGPTAHSGMRQK